jgi:hypothetical protein
MPNTKWACFTCRVSLKGRPRRAQQKPCPRCGTPMLDMGMHFKAPRRLARKQWRKVQLMVRKGYRFVGCPCCLRSEVVRPRGWKAPKSLGDAKRLSGV